MKLGSAALIVLLIVTVFAGTRGVGGDAASPCPVEAASNEGIDAATRRHAVKTILGKKVRI
jgi:hypothetical protein